MTLALISQPARSAPNSSGFELFDFQKGMVRGVYDHIRADEHRILVIAGCGAGKTIIASTILKDATQRAKVPLRCVFLVRLNCLLDQSADNFRRMGIRCSVFQSSRPVDWSADVIVASLQTITARLKKQGIEEMFGGARLFIADEAHEASFDRSYIQIEQAYLPQGARFIGLTGSPWRSHPRQGLNERYDVTVVAPQPPELVKLGRILPARVFHPGDAFNPAELDVSRDGDYVASQVEEQALQQASLNSVVRNYLKTGANRLAVAFCPGVKTAKALGQTFLDAGISAEWQSGSTKMGRDGKAEHEKGILTRKAQDYRLSRGITKVLCNVGTLTAGWDVPEVELVIFYLESLSRCRWVQATGRGSRVCHHPLPDGRIKQDFWVHDYGTNASRFGSPTGLQDYSILPRGKGGTVREMRDKACPNCGHLNPNMARICLHCSYEFVKDLEPEERQEEIDLGVELTEYLDESGKRQVRFLRDSKRSAYRLKANPEHVMRDFRRAYGYLPPDDWHLAAVCGLRPSAKRRAEFEEYLQSFGLGEDWVNRQRVLEFGDETSRRQSLLTESAKWWEVLAVSESAGLAECKAAYRELALRYYPDVCGDDEAETKMKTINRAWDECSRRFGK